MQAATAIALLNAHGVETRAAGQWVEYLEQTYHPATRVWFERWVLAPRTAAEIRSVLGY